MHGGKAVRFSRFLNPKSGRSLIIALDHGLMFGNVEGLEDPVETLERAIPCGVDGVLLSPGVARLTDQLFRGKSAPARILTIDLPMGSTVPGGFEKVFAHKLIYSIEQAVKMAVDAVKILFPWGLEKSAQAEVVQVISKAVEECEHWDMPLVVEPVLWGENVSEGNDLDLIESAARIAVEIGADILKIQFLGESRLSRIIHRLRVPVFVLGGPKSDDPRQILKVVQESMRSGAKGVIFGRNLWQRENMEEVLTALKYIIHDDLSYEEVIQKFNL
ncbi:MULTISPECIES: class I fructose-bisphosphate aldolase [unclassified Thermotoga]|uniref:class I fructose-bisphosphate aldolase n=1 Tax=unclassified Thermotoga TaxID=2631113 RepID=UPI000280E837|nr:MULTISPECIES: fructose-bisphosphate aldolase [unclassified Thermotoga]AIY86187.1 Fructose-bisphosphate aldolase [Thermotoga sp. 2812B]EJX26123.1 Fructose-bisphosphate aldolase [Thermotoga sp. EMP]KAF2959490.1 fructose-bisphosphate aldolase [Thermotoga sp. 38H-to]